MIGRKGELFFDTQFHDLQHTYTVMAIQSGDDIKTVQENLGHATASFTLDVYGHVTAQMKQAQRGQNGELHSECIRLIGYLAIRVTAIRAKKKPLKPLGFKGSRWWTIQDLNL